MHDALPDLARRLRDAARVVFFTGAGVSAESGIPTFRDAQTGLWARYSPEELASPEGFRADPRTVWEWYAWRREKCLAAEPNPAHLAIAALERRLPGVTLITQNVDGLHQRAGSPAPLELHGNLHRLKCFRCEADGGDWPATLDSLPHCACGGLLRPAVVWFGENLPSDVLARASEAGLQAGLFFSVGTSSLVYPAAELPFSAKRRGAFVVEINPQPTPLSRHADLCLHGPAGSVLPELLAALEG
ncbi:SIR2 family NAD-dependent protein deacylase [Azotobacter chroococcum]|uniref:NAD-dependent protein deacylase n=1 Tax=Azotobacter chroococcum TaxID=353 RepID=A0AAP9YAP2_9GAMM|nr:NAD-dependent deacylase [Azotobacter chroococcum]QQE87370.1 NAD-dependent deacylase [Azotobacter chroococcum]